MISIVPVVLLMLVVSTETSEAARMGAPPRFQDQATPLKELVTPIDGPPRFQFKIDQATPLKELLPTPPDVFPKMPGVLNEDLSLVPELMFAKPLAKDLGTLKSQEATAHLMAKINHLNQKSEDGFLKAFLSKRDDVRGLPFLMGKDCRIEKKQAELFSTVVQIVRNSMNLHGSAAKRGMSEENHEKVSAAMFWAEIRIEYTESELLDPLLSWRKDYSSGEIDRATVAALMQMLTPLAEPYRAGLVQQLTTIKHADATRALARIALYSLEEKVRSAAINALKSRKASEYTDDLLAGFRYPLPVVSKRAANALVKLGRKDVLNQLVEMLEQPDPRAPVKKTVDGKEGFYVREVVRVNHHHNCLMCHAPANTADVPKDILTAPVPLPGEPLSAAFRGYGSQASPDIFVRVDMTYLRQDFSLMIKVENAKPWPEMQRFDFFVRTREVTPEEAAEYERQLAKQGTPPSHVAARFALRELTGLSPAEDTPQAWRRAIRSLR